MTNITIRQQLHKYIDAIDDKKIEALYTLLENDIAPEYSFRMAKLKDILLRNRITW